MRECPLLVSDCAVRDQLKRVKVLKKTKQNKKNSQTNKQKKKETKIQIYKFSLYFLCLFSFLV